MTGSHQGTLAQTPLIQLLAYVQQRKLTGTLTFSPNGELTFEGQGTEAIFFQEGYAIHARFRDAQHELRPGIIALERNESSAFQFVEGVDQASPPSATGGPLDGFSLLTQISRVLPETTLNKLLTQIQEHAIELNPKTPWKRFEFNEDELNLLSYVQRTPPAPLSHVITHSKMNSLVVKRCVYLWLVSKAARTKKITVAKLARVLSSVPATRARSTPPSSSSQSRKKQSTDFPPMPKELDESSQQRWKEIELRSATIENQNYFEMFGISKESSAEEAQKIYYELVKRWHPDRLTDSLLPLRPYAQHIFHYLTEANEILSDDEKRLDYLRLVQDGGGTPASRAKVEAAVECAVELQRAEVLLRQRDLPQALKLIHRGLSLNPRDPDGHALLGWATLQQIPATEAVGTSVFKYFNRALELQPKHERAHFYKATALKRAGRLSESLTHFKIALELNPRNVEAAREIRIASMRAKHPSTKPQKMRNRILSKILKKKD